MDNAEREVPGERRAQLRASASCFDRLRSRL